MSERLRSISDFGNSTIRRGEQLLHGVANKAKKDYLDPRLIAFGKQVASLYERDPDSSPHLDTFINLINQGYMPIVQSSHVSFPDGPGNAEHIILDLVQQSNSTRFAMIIAESMRDGHQGIPAAVSHAALEPYMNNRGVHSVGVIRDKDVELGYYTEGEQNRHNMGVNRELLHAHTHRTGILVFPEASLKAGRTSNIYPGRVNGMQKVPETGLNKIALLYYLKDVPFAVLPVAVHGSQHIQSSDTKLPVPKAVREVMKHTPEPQATISVGRPLTGDMILSGIGMMIGEHDSRKIRKYMKENPDMYFDFTMGMIAQMLPDDARGYYRQYASALAHLGLHAR